MTEVKVLTKALNVLRKSLKGINWSGIPGMMRGRGTGGQYRVKKTGGGYDVHHLPQARTEWEHIGSEPSMRAGMAHAERHNNG